VSMNLSKKVGKMVLTSLLVPVLAELKDSEKIEKKARQMGPRNVLLLVAMMDDMKAVAMALGRAAKMDLGKVEAMALGRAATMDLGKVEAMDLAKVAAMDLAKVAMIQSE